MLRDMATPTEDRPQGYSPTAQRLARSVLRAALAHAEREGHVSRNVAALARGPKMNRTPGRTMTPTEARSFLASVAGHRDEAAFVVALTCGLRVSELLGLEWPSVHIDATPATLEVRRSLTYVARHGLALGDVKTATSQRTVHLTPLAVDALKAHRARQATERLALGPDWLTRPLGADLVFRTPLGTAVDPSNFRKALSAATQAAGLGHWHPHELRHSAASLLLSQGLPLKLIADTLGHSSVSVTANVYAHLLDDAKAEAAAAMGRALGGA
jgi:integrase